MKKYNVWFVDIWQKNQNVTISANSEKEAKDRLRADKTCAFVIKVLELNSNTPQNQ